MKAAWWLFLWQSPECLGKGAVSYHPVPGIAWEARRSCGKDPMGVSKTLIRQVVWLWAAIVPGAEGAPNLLC